MPPGPFPGRLPPMNPDIKTIRDLLQVTGDYFAGKGIESARLNAERLLADVLGLSPHRVVLPARSTGARRGARPLPRAGQTTGPAASHCSRS